MRVCHKLRCFTKPPVSYTRTHTAFGRRSLPTLLKTIAYLDIHIQINNSWIVTELLDCYWAPPLGMHI